MIKLKNLVILTLFNKDAVRSYLSVSLFQLVCT
jgi:hypothetical protein